MSRTSTLELTDYPQQKITHPPSVYQKGGSRPISESLLPNDLPEYAVPAEQMEAPGRATTVAVLTTVVCVTMISSMLSGVVVVALPVIARELELAPNVLLWPISIHALTCGCTLLLLGSITDVVGSRPMYLIGCFLQSVFTLACGLAQNSTQIIVLRGFAGIAISFCLPSAVSIITHTFPQGKSRNIAFASMGGGQPVGFSVGLVLGGIFSDTVGWRWAFHICAIVNAIVLVIAFFGLPRVGGMQSKVWSRLRNDIDWVGIAIGSASVALLSYSFAIISGHVDRIKEPQTIAILAISVALIPAFIMWVGRQEKLGRPAVIPNSLWHNRVFTVICIGVFVTWGVFNAMESWLTLFFQDVQGLGGIQTSLRFLPTTIAGALSNIIMGLITHRIRSDWIVIFGIAMTSIGALLMCIVQPQWSYWTCAFFSVFLNPTGADVLFTISNLVITAGFPARDQALAGGVFNTVAQIGKSVGLATSAIIAATVTERSGYQNKESPEALMEGFRAAFWYVFALCCATVPMFFWGLRNIGKVGMKRD